MLDLAVQLQHGLAFDTVVSSVCYSWDGKYVALGTCNSAHVFDAASGRRLFRFATNKERSAPQHEHFYVRSLCFSPDGQQLVTGSEGQSFKVWNLHSCTLQHSLLGHGMDVHCVDVSADNRFIASASTLNYVMLWDLHSGTRLQTLTNKYGPTDSVSSVAVSPSSQHVAAGSFDNVTRVWDVTANRLTRHFHGHDQQVYDVAYSPDARLLLSASFDRTINIWDLSMPSSSVSCPITLSGATDYVLSATFSPNGHWVIAASRDRHVHIWDLRMMRQSTNFRAHDNSVIQVAHNPTNRSFTSCSGDCSANIWLY
ncbi:General transcriptional corepressor tupA [Gracilariopsis chorda]|uniref:General transcriptional corepressor tupA n=1 Tax=Gracilariopsis chorda TaxID=448386 RepID=A0A2V3INM8_9FLOR|nr:General transcriptional corepressor tupA [Gracilariopsis chorda]|eukprot:PXF43691.1 General transcriptional corepressor tupA [Gracilariopsis chorda]